MAAAEFLVPYAVPLSIKFTYDADVQLTPISVRPDTVDVDHVAAFDATGALTNIAGTLGGQSFAAAASATENFSYILLNVHPGTDVETKLGMVGSVTGAGPVFLRASDAQTFRLTHMSFSFGSGPGISELPSVPGTVSPMDTYAELIFTGEEGDAVSAKYYLGTVTPVPLPGAAWLFGSAALAPLALRMRRSGR